MKLCKLMFVMLAALVTASVNSPTISRADDTNAPRVIDFQFINAPPFAAAAWLTRLTGQPVLIPASASFQFTYRTVRKLTRREAIDALRGVLQTNGLSLVRINGAYWKLTKETPASAAEPKPHIDVELQGEDFVVNGQAVTQADLSPRLAGLMTAETEVWVHHPQPPVHEPSFNEGVELLRVVHGLDANRIYTEYLPEKL